jgi:HEAT repeat protein
MTAAGRKKPGTTIGELMAELRADPEWVARMAAKEAERRPIIEKNRIDSAPVVADLVAAGFYVDWIADLFNQRLDYRDAIPILMKWLPRVDNPAVKADIVTALAVKWTPPSVVPMLIHEYRQGVPGWTVLRDAIGHALTGLATDVFFEELVELAHDLRYGKSRLFLVESLGNMKDPRAVGVLMELLDDPEVSLAAIRALGRLGARARPARAKIERFVQRPESWVRKDALKALKRIDSKK